MYSTILWATDGSAEADGALAEALELLARNGTLFAFHCDQRFMGSRVAGAAVYPDESDRRHHIDEQVTDLQRRGYRVEEIVERTSKDPAHEIATIAEKLGVQVIVCGTRSLHGFPAFLSGSVAARLIKHATVPVIVVPTRVREPAVV